MTGRHLEFASKSDQELSQLILQIRDECIQQHHDIDLRIAKLEWYAKAITYLAGLLTSLVVVLLWQIFTGGIALVFK